VPHDGVGAQLLRRRTQGATTGTGPRGGIGAHLYWEVELRETPWAWSHVAAWEPTSHGGGAQGAITGTRAHLSGR
jgi:hypothetical protein